MKDILIVIDMQRDFTTGALANADAVAIIEGIREKIASFSGRVIFTRDTHGENYLSTMEGKNLPVPHCIAGTAGHEIEPALLLSAQNNPNVTVEILDKPNFGAGTRLYEMIAEGEAPGKIFFCGTCTDICVVSNALILKSLLPEVPMAVCGGLCAGLSPEKHAAALSVMESCQLEIL